MTMRPFGPKPKESTFICKYRKAENPCIEMKNEMIFFGSTESLVLQAVSVSLFYLPVFKMEKASLCVPSSAESWAGLLSLHACINITIGDGCGWFRAVAAHNKPESPNHHSDISVEHGIILLFWTSTNITRPVRVICGAIHSEKRLFFVDRPAQRKQRKYPCKRLKSAGMV